jgi:hypothetical protein
MGSCVSIEPPVQTGHDPKKVLLIGINYFNTSNQLYGCLNDIDNMKAMLIDDYKFAENDMLILRDDYSSTPATASTPAITPKNLPTYQNVLAGMRWLVAGAKAGDTLYLHYSGHGSTMRDTNGDEADGQDECICPVDYNFAGFLNDDLIRSTLASIPAGCQLICIFDSCHSATICDLRYNYLQSADNSVTIKTNEQYPELAGDLVVFSGCEDSGTSADNSYAYNLETGRQQPQGAMTFAFLKTLKDANYTITYRRLLCGLIMNLGLGGFGQVPQMSSGKFLNLDAPFFA